MTDEIKKKRMGRLRRALATFGVVAGTAALLAAVGGMNIASAVNSLAQYGYGKNKVVICHKGKKTIRVGKPALKGHLRHGDHEGACTAADRKAAKAKAKAAKAKAKAKHEKSHGKSNKSGQDAEKSHGKSGKSDKAKSESQRGKGKGKGGSSAESDSDDGHGKGKGKG